MMSGSKIRPQLDDADRGCWGHALELAVVKSTVVWTNKATGATYRLVPTRDFQQTERPCREFTTLITADGRQHMIRGVACRRDRKSTRLNSSHSQISYAVFCLKKK